MLTSQIPMPGTYAAAIEYLSRDVVEAIERSLPCPKSSSGLHIWDHEHSKTRSGDGTVRVDEWWICTYCGLTSTTNPIPAEHRLTAPPIYNARWAYDDLTYGTRTP